MCEVINPKNLMGWNSANVEITIRLQTLGLGQVLLDFSSENRIKSRRQRVVTEATRKLYPNCCRTVKFPINYKDQNHNQTRKRENRTSHIKKKEKARHAAMKLAPEKKKKKKKEEDYTPVVQKDERDTQRDGEREREREREREPGRCDERGRRIAYNR